MLTRLVSFAIVSTLLAGCVSSGAPAPTKPWFGPQADRSVKTGPYGF